EDSRVPPEQGLREAQRQVSPGAPHGSPVTLDPSAGPHGGDRPPTHATVRFDVPFLQGAPNTRCLACRSTPRQGSAGHVRAKTVLIAYVLFEGARRPATRAAGQYRARPGRFAYSVRTASSRNDRSTKSSAV